MPMHWRWWCHCWLVVVVMMMELLLEVTLMSVETMFLLVTMVFDDVGSRLWLISSAISVVYILSKQTLVDNPLHMLGSMIER